MLGLFTKKPSTRDIDCQALELKFELPPFRQKANKLPEPKDLWLTLESLSAEPIPLLVEINRFLTELNHTFISVAKRFAFSERCLVYACPAVRTVYNEHQKGKALPQSHAKRDALFAAEQCAKQLALSFKRTIKNDFSLDPKEFKSARRRLCQSACYALEMIYAEQRLKALRYQKLDRQTWRDCNSIFFVLWAADDIERKYKSVAYLPVQRPASTEDNPKVLKTTARDVYITIQLSGMIDPNSMTLQQGVIVENYIRQSLPRLQLKLFNEENMTANSVVISCNQDSPPHISDTQPSGCCACIIDINNLYLLVRQDRDRLYTCLHGENTDDKKEKTDNKAVSSAEDIERLLAMDNV